jgi:hypothetical protein
MHPNRNQLMLHGAANCGFVALRNRNRCAIGVEETVELVVGRKLDRLAEELDGLVHGNGFDIGQKAIADGLKLFRADGDMMFLFHATKMGGIAKISRGGPDPMLAKRLILASIAGKA